MVNKIPTISTDVKSIISFRGEVAKLISGDPRNTQLQGESNVYVDDFEGAQTNIDIKGFSAWNLSSVPYKNFKGSGKSNGDLSSGYGRAKMAWYSIDPIFYTGSRPQGINNNDISLEPMYKRAKQGIGYLAQEASVFRKLTVEENIKAVLELTDKTKIEQENDLENLIKEFSLEKVRKNRGDLLSGGERRRTEIARALATEPKFLLLDEPFAGVDPIAVEEIQKIIAHLKTKNIGVLITDHNVQETLAITDRTYLMFEGKILKSGKPEELAKDEMVRKVYLGQNFIYRRKNLKFDNVD